MRRHAEERSRDGAKPLLDCIAEYSRAWVKMRVSLWTASGRAVSVTRLPAYHLCDPSRVMRRGIVVHLNGCRAQYAHVVTTSSFSRNGTRMEMHMLEQQSSRSAYSSLYMWEPSRPSIAHGILGEYSQRIFSFSKRGSMSIE